MGILEALWGFAYSAVENALYRRGWMLNDSGQLIRRRTR